MEIEAPNESKNTEIEDEQLKYLREILGLKIKGEDLNLFQDMNDLSLFINTLKFADKKKNEIKEKISEDIKKIQNKETFQKLSEDKNRKFSDVVKLNGKTTIYHTAEKDELSQTMHAFYFCDKSKQIFSDKQTAEYKAMHFDTELPYTIGFGGKKEEDNLSSYSNLKQVDFQNDNADNKSKLNKKRKPNNSLNGKQKTSKKQKTEKTNISDDYINTKNGEGMEAQETEYCIPKCKYGRKSKGQPMIQCDKCKEWYHTKCLSFTHEQFQKYDGKGKIWYCPDCSKMDIEDKKNIEGMNKI